jgi:HK97 family phage major capsid protein
VLFVTATAWLAGEMSAASEVGHSGLMLAADGGAAGAAGAAAAGAAAAAGGTGTDEGGDGDRVVDLETARDLLGDLDEDPTDDEIERAIEELQEQRSDGSADHGSADKTEVNAGGRNSVDAERAPDWRRRTVRYIRSRILMESDDRTQVREGQEIQADLLRQTAAMPDSQWEQESERAEGILEDSGLGFRQRRRVQERLYSLDDARDELQQKLGRGDRAGQSTLSGPEGEYLLPQPFIAELYVIIEEYGYARDIFTTIPMTSKNLNFREVATKPVAFWAGELEQGTVSEVKWGQGGMTASKLFGLSFWSNEFEEDAAVAFLPVYTQLLAESMQQKEDKAAFRGDGSKTFGGTTGLLNRSRINTYTLATGETSVQDITLQDEIRDVPYELSKAERRNAAWLLPESTVLALAKTTDANDNLIITAPENSNAIMQLAGYPLVDPEGVQDDLLFESDGASTRFGAFGDFGRNLFGQRRGMSMETSTEAVLHDSNGDVIVNAFQEDATAVRTTERIAFGYPQAGAQIALETAA